MSEKERRESLERHGYALIRLLGRGNFSEVYLVKNRAGACFACKISKETELLRREACAMKGLEHPLFPKFLEFWQEREGYLVMEYAAGSTLEEMSGRRGGFSAECTARIGMELASGLGCLHEQNGMVYRDVKPSNIILCQDGRVKLVDFGCVCTLGEKPAAKAGTPGFAAPEQMKGDERLTAACDVYGLGRTMEAICKREKSRRLRGIIIACVREEKSRRLPDMGSVMKALSQIVGRKEPGSREKGWEADLLKGKIEVQKNIWKSRYKNA